MTRARRRILGLIGVQLGDAAFNAVALYELAPSTWWGRWAREWTKDDLDHLGFPERFRFVFPIVKSTSALGLLLGLRCPRLGRAAAAALVAYFVIALGFHGRVRDSPFRTAPAAVMLVWSVLVLRAFRGSKGA